MSLQDEQRKYERWWLNKKCRRLFSTGIFQLVIKLKVIGPPSGFNAIVEITFEGGKTILVGPPPAGGYKPNKTAMELEPS